MDYIHARITNRVLEIIPCFLFQDLGYYRNILSPLSKHCGGAVGDMTGGWTINPPVTQKQEAEQQKDINYTYAVLGELVMVFILEH